MKKFEEHTIKVIELDSDIIVTSLTKYDDITDQPGYDPCPELTLF